MARRRPREAALFDDLYAEAPAVVVDEPVPDEPLDAEAQALAQAFAEATAEAFAEDVAAVEAYALEPAAPAEVGIPADGPASDSILPPAEEAHAGEPPPPGGDEPALLGRSGETNDLKGGLTWRVTHDPYREKEPKAEAFALFGRNLFGDEVLAPSSGPLSERFTLPPFTVLDARQGVWQDRKRAWLALGIQSELGRGENLLRFSDTALEPDPVKRAAMQQARAFAQDFELGAQPAHGGEGKAWPKDKPQAATAVSQRLAPGGGGGGCWLGGPLTESSGKFGRLAGGHDAMFPDGEGGRSASAEARASAPGGGETGTSIFDPVLTELVYRWFVPPGGAVLDPFAGGSVRGVVAAKLGLRYVGVELRPEQLLANEAQAAAICLGDLWQPAWVEGDAKDVQAITEGTLFDFVLACPPYADLERYSDDPRDLSTMAWPAFCAAYQAIVAAAVASLRPDRFACFVVGDVRGPEGFYRGLPELTVKAFAEAGAQKYNEAVLVTAVGSLPVRVGRQFNAGRKLGKTHQNVLVFVKGDPKAAAEACNRSVE